MAIENEIICADVIDGLKKIEDQKASLVFTSPPYNVNASKWQYNSVQDDQPYLDYIKWLEDVFKECYRILRKGGRLGINIDAMTNRQSDKAEEYIRDIRTDLANVLKPMGFKFFGEHVWYKSGTDPININCPHCSKKIEINSGEWAGSKTAWGSWKSCSCPSVRRNHEYVLMYSKEQFRLEKDENSLDSDLTKEEFTSWISSIWCIQPETKKLGGHPVPFPTELPKRAIKMYSYPGDLVVDPFNGVGTTILEAKRNNRRYIGIDLDKKYCDYAQERLANDSTLF